MKKKNKKINKKKITLSVGFIITLIVILICGISFPNFILFIVTSICGGLIITSVSIIFSSLSFWLNKSDMITDVMNHLMINFATYPDGIFKGIIKIMLFTIVPVGITTFIPVRLLTEFNIYLFLVVILVTILFVVSAFYIFNKGLKRYSSSNLMSARI